VAFGDPAREAVFSLAHELRTRGVAVELDYAGRSAKGQMKQAARSGARSAVIIGEDELAEGTVTVKTLATGEEWRAARIDAVKRIVQAGKDGR
jgi:histidyl-tRNA synthetase